MIQYAALLVVFSDSAGYWMPLRGHDGSGSRHD